MNLLKKVKALRHKAYLNFCHMLPISRNKIILWSDNFKTFGCNPKYIALYLAEHFPGRYDIVWVLERGREVPQELPAGIRIVRYFSMQYLKEISTAKVIICNARTSDYHFFHKRKGQYYIQTWHSSLRLKMIEGDASLPDDYIAKAKEDSKKIDLLLSGCKFSSDIFRRAFWYDGEIFEKGTPRCDIFFGDNSEVKKKVFSFYNIPNEKKLALYAPTFRNDKKASVYGMDFKMLSESLGNDWVVGCRLHPNLNADIKPENCIPMTNYPDMQELLQSCELLITDYSSSMFDMAVAGKKCVLYVPDLENYLKNERNLYFDIGKLPFCAVSNMEELCKKLPILDDLLEKYKNFNSEIGSYECGRASEAVAEIIDGVCFGK